LFPLGVLVSPPQNTGSISLIIRVQFRALLRRVGVGLKASLGEYLVDLRETVHVELLIGGLKASLSRGFLGLKSFITHFD
jgi:hypothetical protein